MLPRFVAARSSLVAAFVLVVGVSGAKAAPQGPPETTNSIVDIALSVNAQTGEFSTLIAALVAADLVETLDGRRQFTVFAPTDAAFSALGLTADNVGSVDEDLLTGILLYHVSPGRRTSVDVISSERIRMLSKQFTFPSVTDEGVFINDDAQIVDVDIEASNGVIHIIDGVLLPPVD